MNRIARCCLLWLAACSSAAIIARAGDLPPAEKPLTVSERYVAIDDVCAWPNLTVLDDGTIIATIFGKPSHGRMEGDVECWASSDGRFWRKRGIAAQHEGMGNRMNVGVGLAKNRDLVVLASGWSLKRDDKGAIDVDKVQPAWSSRSADGA